MPLDWQNVLTSIIGSTTLIGLFVFILQRSFEHRLKRQLEERLEEMRHLHSLEKSKVEAELRVAEAEALKYRSERFDALKAVASFGYRARNLARDITSLPSIKSSSAVRDEFLGLVTSFESSLFAHNLVLGREEFDVLHRLKVDLVHFRATLDALEVGREQEQALQRLFQAVDDSWRIAMDHLQQTQPFTAEVDYAKSPNSAAPADRKAPLSGR